MQPPPPIEGIMSKNCIVLDLETAGNPETLAMPGVMPDFEGRAGTKDPLKLAAQIAEKKDKWLDKVALDPNYGMIIVAGLKNSTVEHVFTGEEKSIIEQTWEGLKDWQELITYNGKSFDVPFLLKRSWYCGIKPSNKFDLFPYRTVNHYDLRLLLSHGDKKAAGKLSTYARLKLGIEVEGVGSDVGMLWELGKIQEIADHCLSDIRVTWELYKSMRGYFF